MEPSKSEEARRDAAKTVIHKAFEATGDVFTTDRPFMYALGMVAGIHASLCAMFPGASIEREAAWEEFQARREIFIDRSFPQSKASEADRGV